MKLKNRILQALVFAFIVCLAIIMPRASSNRLTIDFHGYDTNFTLYKIQSIQNGNYIITDNYKNYDLNYSDVEKLALTLQHITKSNNIKEDYSGSTNNGTLQIENITNGVYLVLGESFISDNKKIEMMPSIVVITKDETIIPKYNEITIDEETYELTIYKTWVDSKSSHPEIIAQLFNDNGLVSEVTLNSSNNFRHIFKNLDKKQNYYVVEKVVPEGYTVSISRQENTIIIKNEGIIAPPPDEFIPQTGQLWWPLPYILLLSIIFGILAFKTTLKKPFITLSITILLVGCMLVLYNVNEDISAANDSERIKIILKEKIEESDENEVIEIIEEDEILEMPTYEIDGIDCIGILDIPSVECSLPVARQWSYDVLKKMPSAYYGNYYNDTLVIAGHNYRTGQFGVLKKVKLDDNIFITNMDGQVFEYKVALIEILEPTEVTRLTDNDYDLTLFTCTYEGQKRLTLRCEREK